MESCTKTTKLDQDKKDEIRRQIAILQAQLQTDNTDDAPTPSKRKCIEDNGVVAPSTPSPKKRKLNRKPLAEPPKLFNSNTSSHSSSKTPEAHSAAPPKPSKLLTNLASLHTRSKVVLEPPARSTSFSEAAPERPVPPPSLQERDDRLALVERLVPGGKDHQPPFDDPHFERLEPNSGIHLSSRKLPHANLQEYLRGRYYVSPSLLYSIIRPLPSNQGYEVPVPGDWLTIAVIAERGPIKLTTTSNTAHDDVDNDDSGSTQTWKDNKRVQKTNTEDKSLRGKKYMSLKLVDFGVRSQSSPSTTKAPIRGDALLNMLLFEADSVSCVEDKNIPKNSKVEAAKFYKGGSGGAFEACMKLHEGAIIAILNPKVLKPYQRNVNEPHPINNVLAITPTSAESIAIIGRSRDLGMCNATKRDGKICGSWCDKRVSDCCEYHIEHAVQRKRAGRAEFSVGTSGMTTTAQPRKAPYDPDRKWGILPSAGPSSSHGNSHDAGSTYVIPGHVVSASGPEYVGEKIGRGREERAKRRREEKKTEEALNRLLGRDGGGGDRNAAAGAVRKAREVIQMLKGERVKTVKKDKGEETGKCAYSAETIKQIGFDPIAKASHDKSAADPVVKRKLDVLASLQKDRGDINLGRRPGKRTRSSGSILDNGTPQPTPASKGEPESTEAITTETTATKMVLLDSDDELEIEPPI